MSEKRYSLVVTLVILAFVEPSFGKGNIDRVHPSSDGKPYVTNEQRLQQVRGDLMYWFFDQGGDRNTGDYLHDIQPHTPNVRKDLDFQIPFFGSLYDYIKVSMDGYVYFGDPERVYSYPLVFPAEDWPKTKDPSFIGIFFSKCRIGTVDPKDSDQRKPGVYYRLDKDLQSRTDQLGVEMRERLTQDIREGFSGADAFIPKYSITVTWKNMAFEGGIDKSLSITNTFQMVLATDEQSTYVIFNYQDLNWSSHPEAGGDTEMGVGGIPAFVGFNAGNGTKAYEYKPYSQSPKIHRLTSTGRANGFPGRHIFKIDSQILRRTANKHPGSIDRALPSSDNKYVLSSQRLSQIRGDLMYWFYDQGGKGNIGDYLKNIQAHTGSTQKDLSFQIPFFGFDYDYIRISINGYVFFSDPEQAYSYPLVFPAVDWPKTKDPSFIGIFFSKCRIGTVDPNDPDQRKPGVYYRLDKDLQTRTDRLGVEMRERLTWDIRESVGGAEDFVPEHAITVTWKDVSFADGIDRSLSITNTFQMVLATDGESTYVIFNYQELNWSSHPEAGGDVSLGEGGIPAFVGFNAGNGTQSYEYKPYSQSPKIHRLTSTGGANDFPGRHVFEIDDQILRGIINQQTDAANLH